MHFFVVNFNIETHVTHECMHLTEIRDGMNEMFPFEIRIIAADVATSLAYNVAC